MLWGRKSSGWHGLTKDRFAADLRKKSDFSKGCAASSSLTPLSSHRMFVEDLLPNAQPLPAMTCLLSSPKCPRRAALSIAKIGIIIG
jgi:hypothetical protein